MFLSFIEGLILVKAFVFIKRSVFIERFVLRAFVSEFRRLEELIKVAGKHTVIELSDLIRASAVELFEVFAGGDYVDVPWIEILEITSYLAV